MQSDARSHISFGLSTELREFLVNAATRFRYLHPGVDVRFGDEVVLETSTGESLSEEVVADFQFCLYREKIYAESLSLRRAIVEGVMST